MSMDGDDEEIIDGTEGEGAAGQDAPAGDEDSEVPAEQPDGEEDDGEQEVVDGAAAKPSRGEQRNQRLANERNAERERANRLEQELIEARRERAQRQEQQTEAQQREMLALMTPDERASWQIQQMERRQQQERQQDRVQIAAMMDKSAFDAKATINPIYRKYQSEIEEQFQRQLAQGRPVEREILLQNHLGKLALEQAGKSGPARRQAKARVDSQRIPAGSGKGDTSSNRGKAGDTPESRLKGVFI